MNCPQFFECKTRAKAQVAGIRQIVVAEQVRAVCLVYALGQPPGGVPGHLGVVAKAVEVIPKENSPVVRDCS